MRISQINQINFNAGTVNLSGINPEKLYCLDAVKKMVADNGFDIYIEKRCSKYLPEEHIYMATASKSFNLVDMGFFNICERIKTAVSCSVVDKKADAKEISVKIFNTVMNAISSLEKKIGL